jgi:hypothetical protein
MLKTLLKVIRGALLSEKNTQISPIRIFKFKRDYDLNFRRYLNSELPPMYDFGSLYFRIHGSYFLFENISRKKVAHIKVQYLPRYGEEKLQNFLSYNGTVTPVKRTFPPRGKNASFTLKMKTYHAVWMCVCVP